MPYTGAQVVTKHKAVVDRCAGKVGWAALECIVDEMHIEYKEIPIVPIPERVLRREERIRLEEELELVSPKPTDTEEQRRWKERYHSLTKSEDEYRRRGDKLRLRETEARKERLARLLRWSYM